MTALAAVSLCLPWVAMASETYAAAVVPSKASQGSAFGIAVHGLAAGETVTAELYASGGEVVLDSVQAVQAAAEAKLLQLELPAGAAAQYTVALTSTDGSLDGSHGVLGQVAAEAALILEADRPIYKPGATIHVRLLLVDSDFKPKAGASFQLLVKDPNNLILQKWEEVTDAYGVFEAALPTSSAATLGAWRFEAETTDGSASAAKTVTLEEYVLPTFEVGLTTTTSQVVKPDQLGDLSIAGAIVPMYTYGEPVRGKATVTVYQKPGAIICMGCIPFLGGAAPMMMEDEGMVEGGSGESGQEYAVLATLEVDVDGETSFEVMVSSASINFYGDAVVVEVSVEDTATGEVQSSSTSLPVAWSSSMVAMQGSSVFVPGDKYTVKVNAYMADGTPMTGTYSLTGSITDNMWSTAHEITATDVTVTDGEGMLEVDLPEEVGRCCGDGDDSCCHSTMDLRLTDADGNSAASKSVSAVQSPSNSMITVVASGVAGSFTVQKTASLASKDLFWALLTAAGGVVQAGVLASDSTTITIEVTAALASGGVLLVYTSVGEEVVAGSAAVAATSAAALPVQLTAAFREAEVEPGQQVNIDVATEEGSRVFLRAVDKSVALASGGQSGALTGPGLLSAFQVPELGTQADEDSVCIVQDALDSAGAGLISHAGVPYCNPWIGPVFAVDAMAPEMADAPVEDGAAGGDYASVTLVRKDFRPTWIWQWLDAASSGGAATLQETAPHSITSWLLTAWAVHPTLGVGVSAAASSLKVFQSFFVRPSLPYATKRGETLSVPVGVFNYDDGADLTVLVTLEADAADFDVLGPTSVELAVPAGGTASAEFQVTGKRLGALPLKVMGQSSGAAGVADAVERMLLVQAEGLPKVDVVNEFLQITPGPGENLAIDSTVPAGAVAGSERCMIAVTGNLLGQTMENLDRLLTIPTGCGEQNLITLVPNVFVAKYLDAVGEQVPAKAITNTQVGIQKQLTYRLDDGSFSAFGMSDGVGSTWLTAFVVKTFAQARALDSVFVDVGVTTKATEWLEGTQQADGSFAEEGRVIHTEMQGGVSSVLSLTAYVLISLLEDVVSTPDSTVADAVISDALAFVAASVTAETPLYATLLSAYALNLACKLEASLCSQEVQTAADQALAYLVPHQQTDGDTMYWEPAEAPSVYGVATSSSVEMTAYAVLAYLAADRVGDAFPAVRWLLLQRSSLGAYRSTQDTVVALQALADYATVTHTSDVDLSIAVTEGAGAAELLTMTVDSSNLEVLQQEEVPCGSSFTLAATGQGNLIVQRSITYNVEEEEESPGMLLNAVWALVEDQERRMEGSQAGGGGNQIEGTVCLKAADSSQTGMTMLVVRFFTGYTVTKETLASIADHELVDKVEEKDGELQIYLADAPREELCLVIKATQTFVVVGLAPAIVEAYDYYHPEVSGFKVFPAAALSGNTTMEPAGTTTVDGSAGSTTKASTTAAMGSSTTVEAAGTTMAEGSDGTTMADGSAGTTMADGSAGTTMADGSAGTTMADGSARTTMPDGSVWTTMADGSAGTTMADGSAGTTMADGSAAITTEELQPASSSMGMMPGSLLSVMAVAVVVAAP